MLASYNPIRLTWLVCRCAETGQTGVAEIAPSWSPGVEKSGETALVAIRPFDLLVEITYLVNGPLGGLVIAGLSLVRKNACALPGWDRSRARGRRLAARPNNASRSFCAQLWKSLRGISRRQARER